MDSIQILVFTAKEYACDDPSLLKMPDTHEKVLELCTHLFKEQKSAGWLLDRADMVTASAVGTILNVGFEHPIFPDFPFLQGQQLLLEKAHLKEAWSGSTASDHGVTNEPLARKCYMDLYQKDLVLYGLIPHSGYPFIGASPDAVSRTDARLVEFKCPHSRPVKPGNPVPGQYWMQCQIQMEVCDLNKCDYFEFKQMKRPPVPRTNLQTITRDPEWFQTVLPLLQGFMHHVHLLRNIRIFFESMEA